MRKWLFLCLFLGLSACGEDTPLSFQGHGEADYVFAAPTAGGRLLAVNVARGDRVEEGDVLFKLDDDAEKAALAAAQARYAEAEARLQDLLKGLREEEIAVLRAVKDRAEADVRLAAVELKRQQDLRTRGVNSQAVLDEAQADYEAAKARLTEAQARIGEAHLPARPDAIEAARKSLESADAALAEARYRFEERQVRAQAPSYVEDVLHKPGEVVNPAMPVVMLLPQGGAFVRFYVPEPYLGTLRLGMQVRLTCTGCAPNLEARIRFISSEVEFAPPLIFSQNRQDKLVYRVEADFKALEQGPRPGQPVTVIPTMGEHDE